MKEHLFWETNTNSNPQQIIYKFENGYGASIIKGDCTYGGKQGLWEVAVITDISFDHKQGLCFELCYTTAITDDVIGYLQEFEVLEILEKIKNL